MSSAVTFFESCLMGLRKTFASPEFHRRHLWLISLDHLPEGGFMLLKGLAASGFGLLLVNLENWSMEEHQNGLISKASELYTSVRCKFSDHYLIHSTS